MWQSPSNGAVFKPDDDFDVGWDVQNTGTSSWDVDSVELTYLGGAKLNGRDSGPLDNSVDPGDEIVVSVHLRMPSRPARYTTYWGLHQGDTYFCRLMLTIYVKPAP
jgi:Ig-like domain-containing protein